MLAQIKKDFQKIKNSKKATLLAGFFKTGKGEYGEGDVFLGIMVPEQRKLAKKYADMSLSDLQKLIKSKFHEHRLTAIFILVNKYKKAATEDKKKFFDFYIKNKKYINNWDLIDLSAPRVIGDYLLNRRKTLQYKLALSNNLWDRRIAVLSTFHFINKDKFKDSLKLAEMLLKDDHNLIHKAVGWMLREIGKRDKKVEEKFLRKYYKKMPRTMLRYAIEKFPEKERRFYLK